MPKQTTISLRRVKYIPKSPEPGVLYVAEEFRAAVHLCACGCGEKVSTPLGPAEWLFKETASGPTLHPSVGNWQLPCKSHYWIRDGAVVWSTAWSTAQVDAGRRAEDERRRAYYTARSLERGGRFSRLWRWIVGLFK